MLLLFDLDGTLLLRATEAHRDAIFAALHRVHRVRDPAAAGVSSAGRTDGEIVRQILVGSGVSADRIDERADDVRIAACAAFARLCPKDLSAHVAPGMRPLLEDLHPREGLRLALLTGNYEAIARLKVRRAGLGEFFASGQGAFGSDHEDRTELPAIARRRAGGAGRPWPRRRTVVIGDTPLDIACARADGVHAVAIATGPCPAEELTGADAVARDTRELRTALGRLLEAA